MIQWLIAVPLSIFGGFITASMLFTMPSVKHAIICLGRCRRVGVCLILLGILIVPAAAITLASLDTVFSESGLALWTGTLFMVNLMVFLGIGIIDGENFWRELEKTSHKDFLLGEYFNFCYTLNDFHFVKNQVIKFYGSDKNRAHEALSKIFSAYRDLNCHDYRKFILVTHVALEMLSPHDSFWRAYREWDLDPNDYIALKEFSRRLRPISEGESLSRIIHSK